MLFYAFTSLLLSSMLIGMMAKAYEGRRRLGDGSAAPPTRRQLTPTSSSLCGAPAALTANGGDHTLSGGADAHSGARTPHGGALTPTPAHTRPTARHCTVRAACVCGRGQVYLLLFAELTTSIEREPPVTPPLALLTIPYDLLSPLVRAILCHARKPHSSTPNSKTR